MAKQQNSIPINRSRRKISQRGTFRKNPGFPNPNSALGKGLSAIAKLQKEQNEVGVRLRESRNRLASMEVEAAVQGIGLLPDPQEELPATTAPDGQDFRSRYQSELAEYNQLKDEDREIESRIEKIRSIPEIVGYLNRPRVSNAPPPIRPVRGGWRPSPRAEVEPRANQEPEPETRTGGKGQPATIEDIKTVLEACRGVVDKETLKKKRTEAVELWLRRRKSRSKVATKAALYRHAKKDKSEFYAWGRGERPYRSAADIDIPRAIITDWD